MATVELPERAVDRDRHTRWPPRPGTVQIGIFVLAVAARVAVIVRHGGLHGDYGYDSGVYFAGADAFIHGRLPYRDFVLLHPPVEMLVLSPFALLTRVMGDESAFTMTVLAFVVLGGVNAVLVTRVALRLDLGQRSAGLAGVFYAVWFGAVGSEYLIKLEPVGNLLFLLALLAAARVLEGGAARWAVLTGVAGGACVSVKIWWVVPFLGLVGYLAWRTRSRRTVVRVLAGGVGVSLLVDGPFFAVSPRAMWSSVVLDQISRGSTSRSPLVRLTDLSSLTRLTGPLPTAAMATTSILVLIVTAWVGRRAWQVPAARPVVVLFAVQGGMLLAVPSWFPYYADFVAVSAAVVVGASAWPVRAGRARRSVAGWSVAAVLAAVTVGALGTGRSGVLPFPGAATLARAARPVRCVMSDSPMGLIELDALSRSFADGCRNWVDVTGRTYGPDRGTVRRVDNARWQRDLTAYLRSGDAVIVVRGSGTGLSRAAYRAIERDGVLARAGHHTLYRVQAP